MVETGDSGLGQRVTWIRAVRLPVRHCPGHLWPAQPSGSARSAADALATTVLMKKMTMTLTAAASPLSSPCPFLFAVSLATSAWSRLFPSFDLPMSTMNRLFHPDKSTMTLLICNLKRHCMILDTPPPMILRPWPLRSRSRNARNAILGRTLVNILWAYIGRLVNVARLQRRPLSILRLSIEWNISLLGFIRYGIQSSRFLILPTSSQSNHQTLNIGTSQLWMRKTLLLKQAGANCTQPLHDRVTQTHCT